MIVRPSTITKAYVEQNAVEVLYKDTHMFITTQNEQMIWIDQIIPDLNTKREVKLKTGFICFRPTATCSILSAKPQKFGT
jgi:hypothetical protein